MTKLDSSDELEDKSGYDFPTRLLGHGTSDGSSAFRAVEHHEVPGAATSPRSTGFLVLALTFIFYNVVGMILVLHYNIVNGDGPSRVANAGYILFSRNPHLAAVGFVWNPLPSIAEMPILLFTKFWPALLTHGLAGTVMDAFFMTGAVWQVRQLCLDRGLPSTWRWIIVGGFAFNPMVILYAGSGMSEAPFIFFMLWSARRLLAWVRDDKIHHLIVAGIAMAFADLTRYEPIVAAVVASVLISFIAALRRPAFDWKMRFKVGAIDGVVFFFPVIVVFGAWSIASWIATGQLFAQFSSQYGNTSQLSFGTNSLQQFQAAAGGPIALSLRDILFLSPWLPAVIIVALLLAVKRVEVDFLIPISIFASVLAFEVYAQISGQTFPLFRYFILGIPFMVVMLILIWPYRGVSGQTFKPTPPPTEISEWWGRPVMAVESGLDAISKVAAVKRARSIADKVGSRFTFDDIQSKRGRQLGALILLFVMLSTAFVGWRGMLNPGIGTATEEQLNAVFYPAENPIKLSPYANSDYIATYLNRLHLSEGTVLVDTYVGWNVWMTSSNRKQFVITSDHNFVPALNAPYQKGILYILVSDPLQDGAVDAVNRRYPTLYKNGAGIATLVLSVPAEGSNEPWKNSWRLYKVIPTA